MRYDSEETALDVAGLVTEFAERTRKRERRQVKHQACARETGNDTFYLGALIGALCNLK